MKLLDIKPANNNKHKFIASFEKNNRIHNIPFGAYGYSDYTIHKDDARKKRYISRHRKNENWNNPMTAGALSRWILWNKKNLDESINDFIRKFKLNVG